MNNANRLLQQLLDAQVYTALQLQNSQVAEHRKLYQLCEEFYNLISANGHASSYLHSNALSWFAVRFEFEYIDDYFQIFTKLLDQKINEQARIKRQTYELEATYRDTLTKVKQLTDKRQAYSLASVYNIYRDYTAIPPQAINYVSRIVGNPTTGANIVQLANKIGQVLKIKSKNEDEQIVALNTELAGLMVHHNSFGIITDPDNLQLLQLNQNNYVVDALSYGPIKGLVDGKGSIYYNGTPLVDRGTKQFPGTRAELRVGEVNQPPPTYAMYESQSEQINKEVKQTEHIIATVNFPNCEILQVTFSASKGRGGTNGDAWAWFTPQIEITPKNGVKRNIPRQSIRGSWRGGEKIWDVNFDLLPSEEYPITLRINRVEAVLDGSENENHYNVFTCKKITGFRKLVPTYPGVAYVAQTFDNLTFSKEPKRTFLIQGRVVQVPDNYDPEKRTYKGTWSGYFKEAFTDNPAWVMYDLLTNDNYGLGRVVDVKYINRYSFYEAAKYYDQKTKSGRPRFTCNLRIEKPDGGIKIIRQIAESCRSNLIEEDGILSLRYDYLQKPLITITNLDVVNGTFTRTRASLTSLAKRIVVTYTNPDKEYQNDTVVIEGEVINDEAQNEKSLTAYGCTNEEQALAFGLFTKRVQEEETDTIEFDTDTSYNSLRVGDVIQIADEENIGKRCSVQYHAGTYYSSSDAQNYTYFICKDELDDFFKNRDVSFNITYETPQGKKVSRTGSKKHKMVRFKGLKVLPQLDPFKDKGLYVSSTAWSFWTNIANGEREYLDVQDGVLTLWDDTYSLEEFKILNKAVDYEKGIIRFTCQRYSSSKYAYADNANVSAQSVPKNYSPAYVSSAITDLTANYRRVGRDNQLEISWNDPAKASNNSLRYNVLVRNSDGKVIESRADIDTTSLTIISSALEDGQTYEVEVHPIYGSVVQDSSLRVTRVTVDVSKFKPLTPTITSITDETSRAGYFPAFDLTSASRPPQAGGDLLKMYINLAIPNNSPEFSHLRIYLGNNRASLDGEELTVQPFKEISKAELTETASTSTANNYEVMLEFTEAEIDRLFRFSSPRASTYAGTTYVTLRTYNEQNELSSIFAKGTDSASYIQEQTFRYCIDLACELKVNKNLAEQYFNPNNRNPLLELLGFTGGDEENIGGYFEHCYPALNITLTSNAEAGTLNVLRRIDLSVNGQRQTYLNNAFAGNAILAQTKATTEVWVTPGVNFTQRYTKEQYLKALQTHLAGRNFRYDITVVIHTPFGGRHRFTRNLGSIQITAESNVETVEVKEGVSSLFVVLVNNQQEAPRLPFLLAEGTNNMQEIKAWNYDLYFNGEAVILESSYPFMNFNELAVGDYSYRIIKRNIYGATKTYEGTARVTAQERRLNYPIELPATAINSNTPLYSYPNLTSEGVNLEYTNTGLNIATDMSTNYSWEDYFSVNGWSNIEDVKTTYSRDYGKARDEAPFNFTSKTTISSRYATFWLYLPFTEEYRGQFGISGTCKSYGNNVWIYAWSNVNGETDWASAIKRHGYKLPAGANVTFSTPEKFTTNHVFNGKAFFFVSVLVEGEGSMVEFSDLKVKYKLDMFTESGQVTLRDTATVTTNNKFVNITNARVVSVSGSKYNAVISYVDGGYSNQFVVTVRDTQGRPAEEDVVVNYLIEGY